MAAAPRKSKSTAGCLPLTRSASAMPEPQAWVQPSVPWPVFRNRLAMGERPISGTLLGVAGRRRSEEHTSELQSQSNLVCRLLLEKKKKNSEKLSEGKRHKQHKSR